VTKCYGLYVLRCAAIEINSRAAVAPLGGVDIFYDRYASSLSDPAARYALQQFCADVRPSYGNAPIPLDTFTR
jgi:hypothetical protein